MNRGAARRTATLWVAASVAGGGLIAASVGLGRVPNLVAAPRTFLTLFALAFASYAAGAWALARLRGRGAFVTVLVVAAAARAALLPAAPTLSTDAYRYVWDARVASAGVSPYAFAPSAPELAALRDSTIYPRLNHKAWRTIYPPGAEAFFRAIYALAPDSVFAMKLAIALAELAALAVLVSLLRATGVPLPRLAIYAWNPLVPVEIWGSAHLDGVAVLTVVTAARAAVAGRQGLAAACLAVGTLVKLYPAVLLPLLLTGGGLAPLGVFTAIVLLGYAPLVSLGVAALGSLPRYLADEFYNPGIVRSLVDGPALTLAAIGVWVAWTALRRREASLAERAVPLIGGFVALSPNVFPWYAVWLVPFLAVSPSLPWIAFTGTVALSYASFLHQPWTVPAWARLSEFLPAAFGILILLVPRTGRPASGVSLTDRLGIPRRARREAAS